MAERHSSEGILTKQSKIAALAGFEPRQVLTTLAHHIDIDWLREAYRRTRKDGATGVDGVDAETYAQALEENLSDLLDRFKSGTYRAPAVRRVHIEKDGGKSTRPLGIPTIADRTAQTVVTGVLVPVLEPAFHEDSYGYRPNRSAHQAIEVTQARCRKIDWVLEYDIRGLLDPSS